MNTLPLSPRFATLATAVALGALALVSCSSSPASETNGCAPGAAPLATATSTAGTLAIAVCTSPQPPVESETEARLTITDARTGEAVDGLTFTVVPWMPAMGHGTSLVPTVTPEGKGTYTVGRLSLFMPGEWELRLAFSGSTTDSASPVFDVP